MLDRMQSRIHDNHVLLYIAESEHLFSFASAFLSEDN